MGNKIFKVTYLGAADYGQATGWVVRARNAIEAQSLVYASIAEYSLENYGHGASNWDIVHILLSEASVIVLTSHVPN